MNRQRSLLLVITALSFVLTTAQPVQAQSPATNVQMRLDNREAAINQRQENIQQRQENAANRKEMIEGNIADRCMTIEMRIDTRVAAFNNNKARHVAQYQRMQANFSQLLSKLEANGYDVSTLRADAATLDTKIKKFATDYAAFIGSLQAARGYACGQSEGLFKAEMEKSRAALRVAQQSSVDVRNYYQTVIRPDIQAVRAQRPAGQ